MQPVTKPEILCSPYPKRPGCYQTDPGNFIIQCNNETGDTKILGIMDGPNYRAELTTEEKIKANQLGLLADIQLPDSTPIDKQLLNDHYAMTTDKWDIPLACQYAVIDGLYSDILTRTEYDIGIGVWNIKDMMDKIGVKLIHGDSVISDPQYQSDIQLILTHLFGRNNDRHEDVHILKTNKASDVLAVYSIVQALRDIDNYHLTGFRIQSPPNSNITYTLINLEYN